MKKILIKHMFEEYGDFMEYIDMYEKCTDATAKVELKKTAEDEMHHYKRIYDILFPKLAPGAAPWTEMESGLYDHATHLYHDMEHRLANLK